MAIKGLLIQMHVEENGYQRPMLAREDAVPGDNKQGSCWHLLSPVVTPEVS